MLTVVGVRRNFYVDRIHVDDLRAAWEILNSF